jgi:hypothetical protein
MSETGRVIDLDWAYLVVGKDELSIIQKDGVVDCPKIRFATRGIENSLGAFSWNLYRPTADDPWRMEEQILLQGKIGDEQDYQGPMLRVDMTHGGEANDRDIDPIFKLSWKELWSAVPVVAPNFSNAPTKPAKEPFRLVTPGEELKLEIQSDGNQVLYDYRESPPKAVARVAMQKL